jgi:hypothetical protein
MIWGGLFVRWNSAENAWGILLSILGFQGSTGTLFYLTTHITLHSNCLALREEAQRLPLFQFAVSRGSHLLVQTTAVNITLSLAIFRSAFLRPADKRHISRTPCLVHVQFVGSMSRWEVTCYSC